MAQIGSGLLLGGQSKDSGNLVWNWRSQGKSSEGFFVLFCFCCCFFFLVVICLFSFFNKILLEKSEITGTKTSRHPGCSASAAAMNPFQR